MITSNDNRHVKRVRELLSKHKARVTQSLFVVEGVKMTMEAEVSRIEEILMSESFYNEPSNKDVVERIASYGLSEESVYVVKDSVFASMSETRTPQGIMGVIKIVPRELDELFDDSRTPFIMVLEALQDPGNVGTIIRTAEGAGVTGIIMSADCVDLYNPKTVRSTMGALYRMKVYESKDLKGDILILKGRGVVTYAAHLQGENYYYEEDFKKPTCFFIGNEGNGLTDETAALADKYIKIPMEGHLESLNAAVASSVLMYETLRQRRMK